MTCRSVRQSPHARTRSNTWPGPGTGSGTSRISSAAPGRVKTAARIRVDILLPFVRRVLQILALLTAMLVGGQAFASAGPVLVCRYTGKVIGGCPCPSTETEPPTLSQLSCCEIRQPAAPPAADSERRVDSERSRFAAALPSNDCALASQPKSSEPLVERGQDAPP